jgi:hypothetical protein
MCRLQRLHMVDSALSATSSSVPHSKHVTLRCSISFSTGRRFGAALTAGLSAA